MKKIISILLCFALILSYVPTALAIEDNGSISWNDRKTSGSWRELGREWRFLPPADYQSMQNPPSFSWPSVSNAYYYDLIVATDKEMNNVVYKAEKIKNNYYNFGYSFKAGVTYYWSVRFVTESETSKWMEASRFVILPEAYDYAMPDVDKLIEKIKNSEHPRVGITAKTLNEDRSYKDLYSTSKQSYDNTYKLASNDIAAGICKEDKWGNANDAVFRTAFMYALSGEKQFGEFAKKQLMEIATWDVDGRTRYSANDQAFRATMYNSALAYDYLYDMLSKEEKVSAAVMIKKRMCILENPADGLSDNIHRLHESPYLSHGWTAVGFLLGSCVAMMGEFPEAEAFFRQWLPVFINLVPHSYEDGDYSGGPSYWSYADGNAMIYCLKKATGFDLTNRPQYKNNWKVPMYYMSSKLVAEFGDEGGQGSSPNANTALAMLVNGWDNPYMKWKWNQLNLTVPSTPMLYFLAGDMAKGEEKSPASLPRSNYFKDTGVVTMHSDLVDESDKVSLYFRSSPFASFNHAHNDQNSFHIHAFGERLAIDSGYYDFYQSAFDFGYTKRTYAHNAITYDSGKGQPPSCSLSKGQITNFLTHPDLDLVSGDATEAYNYEFNYNSGFSDYAANIDKAKRHIIYLRPDTFIVLDDLKSHGGDKHSFEWWLNGYSNISMYNERNGARITQGNAVLDAKIEYPKVTGYYSDIFSGPDMEDKYPLLTKYKDKQVHKRVWFETPKTNATRIIATLNARRTTDEAKYVKSEQREKYMYLSFEDGTKAYISTEGVPFNTGRFETDGEAVVVKGDTIMVVDGTYLKKDNEEYFQSDVKISFVYGKDEISVSGNTDFNLTLKIPEIKTLKTYENVYEKPNQLTRGFKWNYEDNSFKVTGYKGCYSYYINDKAIPGGKAEDYTFKYSINDKENQTIMSGYYNHDGEKTLSGKLENSAGFYKIDEIKNVKLRVSGAKSGDVVLLGGNEAISTTGDATLKLTALNNTVYNAEPDNDHNGVKSKLSAYAEAEDVYENNSDASKYTTRPFLSGGAGLNGLNQFGQSATWELNVPAQGKYDLVIKSVTWSGVGGMCQYVVNIDGNMCTVNIPETGSYGASEIEWVANKVKIGTELKKGKVKVTIYPMFGSWNMDWVGLIKAE